MIRKIFDFSSETREARRKKNVIFKVKKEKKRQVVNLEFHIQEKKISDRDSDKFWVKLLPADLDY